ncbi:MAG TPA: amidohydrolase family protein [Terracidiphilus sp.]|nr:amidohydrolase family protein [Terracidiphilus sp.]
MRIDAHQHFWRYDEAKYAWISGEMAALKRDFLPEDLRPLGEEAGFDGCVAVQARHSVEETEWLLELADANAFVRGVVGWVDLCSPDGPRQLERLTANRKLVGVRHVAQDEADDEFLLRPEFRRGIARLEQFGLAYDILIYPRHLRVATEFARGFPNQRFVLDHIAKPLIAERVMSPWDRDVRRLAGLPNVFCKLSGMVTEARWKQWTREDFRPYLDVVLEAFGPARLMIGSDWPVCTLSANYRDTMAIVMEYIAELSAEERAAILGENCAAFYRLPE